MLIPLEGLGVWIVGPYQSHGCTILVLSVSPHFAYLSRRILYPISAMFWRTGERGWAGMFARNKCPSDDMRFGGKVCGKTLRGREESIVRYSVPGGTR